MDSDGIDMDTIEVDTPYHMSSDEGGERDPSAPSSYLPGYHSSYVPDHGAWWDASVDGEQGWGLTDEDSMSTSEGELSFGDRFSGTLRVAHNWSFP